MNNYFKTLTLQSNVLDGLTCFEEIDITILDKLIKSKLLKNNFHNPTAQHLYSTEKQQLLNYKELVNDGKAVVKYNKVENGTWGRSNPDKALGLFSIRRQIRHTLAKNKYIDIDIVNAHPNILLQVCDKLNISCDKLRDYCTNRNEYLEYVINCYKKHKNVKITRDIAKNIFIIYLYLGGFKRWLKNNDLPKDLKQPKKCYEFKEELEKIAKEIYKNNEEIVKFVKERKEQQNKKEYNKYSSVLSYYLQEIESRILETIYLYCIENKHIINNNCVLCADGLMIQKELYNDNLPSIFSKLIKEKFDLDLEFTTKEMNEDYLEILDNNLFDDVDLIDFWEIADKLNQSDVAKIYYAMEKNKYIRSERTGWYEYNDKNILVRTDGIPSSLLNSISEKLQNYANKMKKQLVPKNNEDDDFIYKMKLFKKAYISFGNANYIDGVIKFLKQKYTVDRLDDKLNANSNLVAFDDLVYDFTIKDFRAIKPQDYISKTVQMNAPKNSNNEIREKIKKLLYSIFENNEMVEYWTATTALSIFTNKFEKLFIHCGTGGNGKGVLFDILRKCLGQYFFSPENSFLTTSFKAGQPNPSLASAIHTRFLVVSEPDNGDNNKLNIDFVKMMTGRDVVSTRELYGKLFSYIPQFTTFLMCNKKPVLTKLDNGLIRRIRIINYPFNFVDNPVRNFERKKNNNLKDEINTEYCQEFLLYLFESAQKYMNTEIIEPKEVKEDTDDYFNDSNPLYEWFNKYLTITDDKNDKILCKDVLDRYNRSELAEQKFTAQKMNEYLLSKNVKRVKSSGYYNYYGIKWNDVQEEEEEENTISV